MRSAGVERQHSVIGKVLEEKMVKGILHKLFNCPTFWRLKPFFQCPICGKRYRCYWDGHDVEKVGINLCKKCAEKAEKDKITTSR